MTKIKQNNKDYAEFEGALQKILRVSSSELKTRLEQDKKTKKRRIKRPSASRA